MKLAPVALLLLAESGGSARKLGESSSLPQPNGKTFESTNCLDEQIAQLLQANDIPGANLAVLHQGQLVYEQGYGTRDAPGIDSTTENRPALPSTPFRIMSISKTITSFTTLIMAQRGLLNLDDVVFGEGGVLNYMLMDDEDIETTRTITPDPRISDITIRHLLSHTSGFSTQLVPGDPTSDPIYSSRMIAHDLDIPLPISADDIIRYMLNGIPLSATPGTVGEYNNFGYCVLGRVIEAVSKQSYEKAVQKYLLKPEVVNVNLKEFYLGRVLLEEIPPQEAEYKAQPPLDFLAPSVYENDDGAEGVSLAYGGMVNTEIVDSLGGWVATSRQLLRVLAAIAPPHCVDDCLLGDEWIAALTAPPQYPWPVSEFYAGLGIFVTGLGNDDDEVTDDTNYNWLLRGDNAGSLAVVENRNDTAIAILFNGNNATGIIDGATFATPFEAMAACVEGEWPALEEDDGSAAWQLGCELRFANVGVLGLSVILYLFL